MQPIQSPVFGLWGGRITSLFAGKYRRSQSVVGDTELVAVSFPGIEGWCLELLASEEASHWVSEKTAKNLKNIHQVPSLCADRVLGKGNRATG